MRLVSVVMSVLCVSDAERERAELRTEAAQVGTDLLHTKQRLLSQLDANHVL